MLGAAFVLAVLTAMAFGAALYMDVIGAVRSHAYNPATVWHADHIEPERERIAIELHDSEVTRMRAEGADLVLNMEVYVHHSMREPGRDPGTGWIQGAEVRLRAARAETSPRGLPAIVAEGMLRMGGHAMRNLLPLPLGTDGPVRLEVTLTTGETLAVDAEAIDFELLGRGECVEIFRT
jgi:hypothetical protein